VFAGELLHLPGKPAGVVSGDGGSVLAGELLHLPDKPAGVVSGDGGSVLAGELLHLPGKPAGVVSGDGGSVLAGELLHLPGKPAGVRDTPKSGTVRFFDHIILRNMLMVIAGVQLFAPSMDDFYGRSSA
jgi:hypothetical protein